MLKILWLNINYQADPEDDIDWWDSEVIGTS
nr:MAG TPA: hypothetical protein [Caudoviricetes sp.]